MKKNLLIILSLLLCVANVFSSPIDVNTARKLGQKFVANNFSFGRTSEELDLIYTSTTTRGEVCFYIFNVADKGFVIVSGTDATRPVLAYSDENTIDADNMSPGLSHYLDTYNEAITYLIDNSVRASSEVEADWEALRNTGKMVSRNGGRAASYLVTTKWNQNYPYNYSCPAATGGPGGHVYAGCVATAMSQVFNFWQHPAQGQGIHTDYYSFNGQSLTVNFGNTIYDWDNMPEKITSSSPQVEINAVSTLMYHAGVAVNMQYAIDGSGAYTQTVPSASATYFTYSTAAVERAMSSYSATAWLDMLKESFDMGWPLYYAARDNSDPSGDGAGHAFVTDGYDDNDLVHFNWGWSGSGDGFYSLSAPTAPGYVFKDDQRAIFNLVPNTVYNSTPKAPTNVTAVAQANNALKVDLAWKNPTQYMNGNTITQINKVVVERNGVVVHTENNPTPGSNLSWTDDVPCYSTYKYQIYAIVNDSHGATEKASLYVGPTCGWTIMMTSNVTAGYRDGYVSVIDAAGNEYGRYTTTTSSLTTHTPQLPLGNINFVWTAPTTSVSNMTIIVKNPQNTTVFTHTGSSDELAANFLSTNSRCENITSPQAENLMATAAPNNDVTLTWDPVRTDMYGYNIYKDGSLMSMTYTNTYTYNEPLVGGHCYYITVLTDGGEGLRSNESCVQIDNEGVCCPATDLYYQITSNNKIKLMWTKPVCSNFTGSKCGYYIYKQEGDGPWSYVMKGASTTSYTDNSVQPMKTYHYKVVAVYEANTDEECLAMPANDKFNPTRYQVDVELGDGVEENMNGIISIYPNPAKDKLNVKGENINSITMYNVVGQMIYHTESVENNHVVELSNMPSGIYMVKVNTDNGETVQRVSVVK